MNTTSTTGLWHFAALLLLQCSLLVVPAFAQSPSPGLPEANPGRPTVATPATLTPVGYLQFESGYLGASDSPGLSSQNSFNEVVKLTVTPRLQLLASSEPVASTSAQGTVSNLAGDVSLGVQGVIYQGEGARPTLALSYFHRVYSGAAPDLDIEGASNSFVVLASADVHGFHYDANAFFSEVVESPARRAQYGQAISVSHPFLKKFTLSGEIWHFTQPFLRGDAVGNLWGVSYALRKNLVLDVAFNRGLTATSTRWEGLAGFTYVLPQRLWPSRGHL